MPMLHMPWKMALLNADHQQHQPANGGKLGGAWEQGYLFLTWGIHRGLYYTSVIIDLIHATVYTNVLYQGNTLLLVY